MSNIFRVVYVIAISDILKEMKDRWEISDKQCHLIRDNAANIRLGT